MATIDGQWAIEIATPMGVRKFALDLTTNGSELTGTATGSAGSVPIKDASREADRASFGIDVTSPFPLTVKLDLRFADDAVMGEAQTGPFPASTVTGRRATAADRA